MPLAWTWLSRSRRRNAAVVLAALREMGETGWEAAAVGVPASDRDEETSQHVLAWLEHVEHLTPEALTTA